MENQQKRGFWLKFLMVFLSVIILILASFFAGAYWKVWQFRSNFELLPDINQCY